MDKILYDLCQACVSIMDGWHPYPATCIAERLNQPVGKVRYHLRKLKKDGLVYSFHEGGMTDDGAVFCSQGWGITEKAKDTEEYKKAYKEEVELCKKCFGIDIDASGEEMRYC